MKGFIVYHTYEIKNNKAEIVLFGRLENKESFLAKIPYRPYFFIKKKEFEKSKKINYSFETEESDLKNFDEKEVVKVILNVPRQVSELRKLFEEEDIKCYEADIRFSQRFLIDKGIKGALNIEGDFEKGDRINRIYDNPLIEPAEYVPKLKTLSIDIETSTNLKDIYCISLSWENKNKVLMVSNEKVRDVVCFGDEKSLLLSFKEKIKEIDPDIITGWNLIDFDLFILYKKFKKYKMSFDLGRMDREGNLRIEQRFLIDSKADFPGRQILDGIHLLKTSFVNLSDYKLDTAAKVFLGDKKLISFGNKGKEIETLYKENKEKLAKYNLKDAQLVLGILDKTGVVELTVLRSLLTGMPLDRVRATIASFDSLYLHNLRERNYVAKTSSFKERGERIKGGFVMKSKPGIYDNILVMDFKSLYPSIIRTYNIDPLAYSKGLTEKKPIVAVNKAKFGREEGILPVILQNLWRQRDRAKEKNDELSSYAIKILMNSFFGALANPSFRFYSLEIANAITHTAQYTIKTTMSEIEKMGYKVIYGDTDSIFINTQKELEKTKTIAKKIEKEINKFWAKKIEKEIKRTCFLELEFDKLFTRFFMPKVRHAEEGSKKRYAGLKLKDGKEEISFTGLEAVRRDWTDLAKKFQQELFLRIFKKQDFKEYVQDIVQDLKKGKYDDLLVYKKGITKALDEYVKTTPPHVKAARQLDELTSNIIEYYITVDGPQPIQKLKGKIDYEHYIEKQLKPIADTILYFLNENFDDILKDKSQKTLSNW